MGDRSRHRTRAARAGRRAGGSRNSPAAGSGAADRDNRADDRDANKRARPKRARPNRPGRSIRSGRKIRTKHSYGVFLVDFEPGTGRPVGLFDRRRYSYAFAEIVHDHISGRGRNGDRAIAAALAGTTVDEKLLLRTLDFRRIFAHIWSYGMYDTTLFTSKQRAFVGRFVAPDGGRRFVRLIDDAASSPTQWEIPKGRPEAGEEAIDCAVREMHEETGVDKSAYRLHPEFTLVETVTQGDTCYCMTYFLAVARGHLRPTVQCRRRAQVAEVAEVRWLGLDELRAFDAAPGARKLAPLVRPAFRYARQRRRGVVGLKAAKLPE